MKNDDVNSWTNIMLNQIKNIFFAIVALIFFYFIGDVFFGDTEIGINIKLLGSVPLISTIIIVSIKAIKFEIKQFSGSKK